MSKTSRTSRTKHKEGKEGKGKGHSSKHEEQESEPFHQTLNIIVYRGDPVDAQSTRHTSFFIEFSDGSSVLSHAVGGHGFFEHEERWNTNPSESRHHERTIPVARIQTRESKDLTLRNILFNVPVNNQERAWNCQSWIGDGLKALENIIPAEVAITATNQMVDVLLEAPDEN